MMNKKITTLLTLFALPLMAGRALASDFVSVPGNYVYNPKLGPLHDYCTSSPDEFPNPVGKNADFRGPCAKHDLCYGSHTDKKKCDVQLLKDMRTNCAHAYGAFNPTRGLCEPPRISRRLQMLRGWSHGTTRQVFG